MRVALLLLAVSLASPVHAQLAGTYTVGGASPDYATPAAAVADLVAQGVSGAVTLRIRSGTYAGPLTIPAVAGVSATNTVRLLGVADATTGALPVIQHTPLSGAEAVVTVTSPHVRLDGLHLKVINPFQPHGDVLRILADHADVRNCRLESVARGNATTGGATALQIAGTGAQVLSNTITGGTRGIDVGGAATGGNTRIRLNSVEADSLGIVVRNQSDATGGLVIRANTVAATLSSFGFAGIRVDDVAGAAEVSRNQVTARRGVGIEILDATGTAAAPVEVTSNTASVIQGAFPALRIAGAAQAAVYHNTLYTFEAFAASLAVDGGAGVRLRNNLLRAVNASGWTLDVSAPAAVDASDTNGHSAGSAGDAFRARWSGVTHATLAAYQAASGTEGASRVVPVTFVSTVDLHLAGASVGDRGLRAPPLPLVTVDVDGQPRDAVHPYLGADEADETLADPPPLAGLYTVGPTGDFASLADVLNDLSYGGVAGDAEFAFAPGVYTGAWVLPTIAGAGPTARVTFSGQGAGATVRHAPTGTDGVVRVDGDWITLRNLRIENTAASFATGRGVVVGGDDVTLDDLVVDAFDAQTAPPSNLFELAAGVFVDGAARTTVTGSTIARAAVGVHAVLGATTAGPTITDNAITESYAFGVFVSGGTGTVVSGNEIAHVDGNASAGADAAVRLDAPRGAYRVEGNEIAVENADGVQIDGGASDAGAPGRVANNLISAYPSSTLSTVPLDIRSTANLQVYHNTLHTSNFGVALVVDDGGAPLSSGLDVANTLGDGGQHAFDVASASAFTRMDFDTWWGGTDRFVVGGVSYVSLDALRAATGLGLHSHELNPTFVRIPFDGPEADLRLAPSMGGAFALAGTPLPEVPTDIDGAARSATFPYVGAHELPVPIAPVTGTVTVGPGGDYPTPAALLADLATRGVSGPVTAIVGPGTYAGALALGAIPGAGPDARLTIRGPLAGDRPVIESAGEVLDLTGTAHVTVARLLLRRTTAGTVVDLNGTSNVTLDACVFELPVGATTGIVVDGATSSIETANQRVTVRRSTILRGGVGVRLSAIVTGLLRAPAGNVVEDNTIEDVSGVGIEFRATLGTIAGNTVRAAAGAPATWVGIDVDFVQVNYPETEDASMRVERNRVVGGAGTGILWGWSSSGTQAGAAYRLVNNAVSMTGGGATRGLDLSVPKSLLVAHNTVRLTSTDTTSVALRVGFCNVGAACNFQSAHVRNNVLLAGAGRALDVDAPTAALETSEWNLFATSGPTLVEWWATRCATLACHRDESGVDRFSSAGTAVTFADAPGGDLHLGGGSAGDAALASGRLEEVTDDLDGDPRTGGGVYLGADEVPGQPVTPPRTTVPLTGVFTIDPAGGDFASFDDAVDRLYYVGLGGTATFEAAEGTYAERVEMRGAIPGASAARRARFRPADGADVVVQFPTTEFLQEVWEIEGASHVTVEGLTLRPTGGTYSTGLRVRPLVIGSTVTYADSVVVRGARFEAPSASLAAHQRYGVYASGVRGFAAEDNTFEDTRLVVTTDVTRRSTGVVLTGNTSTLTRVTSPGFAVFASADDLTIRRNQMTVTSTACGNHGGIELSDVRGAVVVGRNAIRTNQRGLRLTQLATSTTSGPLYLVNNAVAQDPAGCSVAVELRGNDVAFLHNSVRATAAAGALLLGATSAVTGHDLRHNLLVGAAGPALTVEPTIGFAAAGANGLWSATPTLATWHGAAQADLAALQSASGLFGGAVQTLPAFVSDADLHLASAGAVLSVPRLPEVADDVDGTPRPEQTLHGAHHRAVDEVRLLVRALLHGAYPLPAVADGTPDAMRTALVGAGLVPTTHPYADAAYDGRASECDVPASVPASFFEAHPDVVDWVVVGLRSAPAGPSVACRPALLRADGVALALDGAPVLTLPVAAGDYHVVVAHRTHLATMTATPVALSATASPINLTSGTHYGGGGRLVEPGVRALVGGDADGDGTVDAADLDAAWRPQVGQTGYLPGDLDLDGRVLAGDRQRVWAPAEGSASAVPAAGPRPTAARVAATE